MFRPWKRTCRRIYDQETGSMDTGGMFRGSDHGRGTPRGRYGWQWAHGVSLLTHRGHVLNILTRTRDRTQVVRSRFRARTGQILLAALAPSIRSFLGLRPLSNIPSHRVSPYRCGAHPRSEWMA